MQVTAARIDVTTPIIGGWRIAEVCGNMKSVAVKIGPSASTRNASVVAVDVVHTLSPSFNL